jgi:hydroxypyruvate reductase
MSYAPADLLRALFLAAVAAADPSKAIPSALPPKPRGRTIVVGAGKAAASMAAAVEAAWDHDLEGLVVTRYGHSVPTEQIEVIEAGHPVPDEAGHQAAKRIAAITADLSEEDLVLCLMSGGGSALLALPVEGVSLADLQAVNRALLISGATISDINCVRKHLSQLQGGQLAANCWPAKVVTLAISDVPGDDIAIIASGPTVADPTTAADALLILQRYDISLPASVSAHLQAGVHETIKPNDRRLFGSEYRLIASPRISLEAAAAVAKAHGVTPVILGDRLEGEAREVGYAQAGIARQVLLRGQPVARPCVLLSGGETTVTVRGSGRGGRNVEFLLSVVLALDGLDGVYALAADTDGIDGTEDNAGALASPSTLSRAHHLGMNARAYLDRNDAYSFFAAVGDLLITGPTRTNVNDFRALLLP